MSTFVPPESDGDWRPVVGQEESYLVSSDGRLYNLLTGGEMTLSPHGNGRLTAYIAGANRFVHHLVLEAFIGPCPPGFECLHYNDNPADNRLENLRWGTPSENMYDRVRNGRHHNAVKTNCPQGHDFTPQNTYRYPNGARGCRTCRRMHQAAYRARRKAATSGGKP